MNHSIRLLINLPAGEGFKDLGTFPSLEKAVEAEFDDHVNHSQVRPPYLYTAGDNPVSQDEVNNMRIFIQRARTGSDGNSNRDITSAELL